MKDCWTKTPNEVYAAMCEMKESELRITLALVRETYGRHKTACKITYEQLHKMTGMISESSIKKGLTAVIKRGFFVQGEKRGEWLINENPTLRVDTPPTEEANPTPSVDELSTRSVENTQGVDNDSTLDVGENTTLSVGLPSIERKKEERKGDPPTPTPPVDSIPFKPSPNKSKHPPGAAQERINVILDVCGLDGDIPAHRHKADEAAAQLAKYAPDYIRRRYEYTEHPNGTWQWYRDDWRGRKRQKPTTADVVDTISMELAPELSTPAGNGQVDLISAAVAAAFEDDHGYR